MIEKQTLHETAWHTKSSDDVLSEFEADKKQGLSNEEAGKRREKYGPNTIRTGEKNPGTSSCCISLQIPSSIFC